MKRMIDYQDRSFEVRKYRERYKPEKIKLLIVGESPPHSGDDDNLHFFYNPEYNTNDNLYKAISSLLFSNNEHLSKHIGLKSFMGLGFYLLDATDKPINKINDERIKNSIILSELPTRMSEIELLILKTTPIILIKKNIFQLFNEPLRQQGFNVLNDNLLPFPLYESNIVRFKEDFKRYIDCL
jgi:hypothetical protein